MDKFIILHAPDATEVADMLQLQLIEEGLDLITFSEILLEGPLDIPSLVASASGVIIILTSGLHNDTMCLTMAKHAIRAQKGLVVIFEDITTPSWSNRPFRLSSGEMYDVEWGFFLTQIHSHIRISELGESWNQDAGCDENDSEEDPDPDTYTEVI